MSVTAQSSVEEEGESNQEHKLSLVYCSSGATQLIKLREMNNHRDLTAANSPDFSPVCILFSDEVINELFAELLAVRGVEACIVHSIKAVPEHARIITEPHFFTEIPAAMRHHCLLVGNKDALKGLPTYALSRPLTEEKIETALGQLLGAR